MISPSLNPKKVLLMGVVNVTPDSFSDGGCFLNPSQALAHACALATDGADIIDIGAESSRPGATPITTEEEWGRLAQLIVPLHQALSTTHPKVRISVDTIKPEIMYRAADHGVGLINDIAGGQNPETLKRLSSFLGLQYVAMQMHGTPQTMQHDPLNGPAAVAKVEAFFVATHARLTAAGFSSDRIWLDPGIGFGKSDSGNLHLIAQTKQWAERYNLTIGISRKSFIGRALGLENPKDRDGASKMLEVGLIAAGARMIRTHDVKRLKKLLALMKEGN